MTWHVFEEAAPALAAYALGRLAYLATVRPDGGPRVHPVTPIIGSDMPCTVGSKITPGVPAKCWRAEE